MSIETTTTDTLFASHADVLTDTPARYAKQLVGHLGHKIAFVTDGTTSTATIAWLDRQHDRQQRRPDTGSGRR